VDAQVPAAACGFTATGKTSHEINGLIAGRKPIELYNRAAMVHVKNPRYFAAPSSPSLESWHNEYQDANQRTHKNDRRLREGFL
jgi:hypothetical protein